MDYTILAEVTQHVLTCVCASLYEASQAVEGQPGCPCRACTAPGAVSQIAWECPDKCTGEGDGGSLTVVTNRLYISSAFPNQSLSDPCEPATTVADVSVVLLRCVPVFDENLNAPSCEALDRAAQIQNIDMMAMLQAARCCVPNRPGRQRKMRTVVGDFRTIGPQGGCAGAQMQLLLDIGSCDCTTDES